MPRARGQQCPRATFYDRCPPESSPEAHRKRGQGGGLLSIDPRARRGRQTVIDRPYQHLADDALADEIAVARECIQTTRDLRLRKQMQGKLSELIAEENRRFTDGLPF